MNLYYILTFTFILIGCSNKEVTENKKINKNLEELNSTESMKNIIMESEGIFKAVGHFDEKNNLKYIERYFNGELIIE